MKALGKSGKQQRRNIILKMDNDRVWMNLQTFIFYEHTNLPKKHFKFRISKPVYWRVEMLDYSASISCLRLKVIDYDCDDNLSFPGQLQKREIRELMFDKLDWKKFEPDLIEYRKSAVSHILENPDANLFDSGLVTTLRRIPESLDWEKSPTDSKREEIKILRTEFWVYFVEAKFRLGYVSFTKQISGLGPEVEFQIKNDNILPEFDLIKFWFARKLKTKKFKVSAVIHHIREKIFDSSASSKHIDAITPELIEAVKYQRTFGLMKSSRFSSPDKSLFTSDDIFGQFGEDEREGNIFNQSDEEILKFLLERSNIRNRKQLEYLSGMKQSESNKLRFTLHPLFGFLFFIEGKESNHFVWELLNSHATYVWSVDKASGNKERQFRRIEDTINSIRSQGREQYKQSYRRNHIDNDLAFRVIEHEDISSDFVDSFPRWKVKLNEQLI